MKLHNAMFLFGILLSACSTSYNQEYQELPKDEISYPVTTYLTDEMKDIAKRDYVFIDIMYGQETFVANADYIVLASVISLDQAETVCKDGTKSQLGYTFGKMLIQRTYKGNTLDGQVVDYMKLGGVLSESQLDEAISEEQANCEGNKEGGDDITVYVNTTALSCDIALEEGKTYFMALSFLESMQCYEVTGFNFTTREASLPQTQMVKKIASFDHIQLKNNETGEYQTIDETLKEMQIQ